MSMPRATFVAIKNEQVLTAETIEVERDAIVRKLNKFEDEGAEQVVAVYGDGLTYNITFPQCEEALFEAATIILIES